MTGFQYNGILSFFIYRINQDQSRYRIMYINEQTAAYFLNNYQDQGIPEDRNPGNFDVNLCQFIPLKVDQSPGQKLTQICVKLNASRLYKNSQARGSQRIGGSASGVSDCNRDSFRLQSDFSTTAIKLPENSNLLLIFYLG